MARPAAAPALDPQALAATLARGSPGDVEIRETHISWVLLAGERAYKLKKPLVLLSLDYGTPARRREMCAQELRLNKRLAEEIYVRVRGVTLTGSGPELTDEDDLRRPTTSWRCAATTNRGRSGPPSTGAS